VYSQVDVDRDDVQAWARQLERDLERYRIRDDKWRGDRTWDFHGERWAAQQRDAANLYDLIRRGLDPSRPRRFKGRVSLTIRCEPRGHLLALVYPTCDRPVLVPSVSCLPATTPEKTKQHQHKTAETRRLFGLPADRDKWIEVWFPQHEDERMTYDIRGLSILDERHRQETVQWEPYGLVRPSWFLLCRCGQRIVPAASVMKALDAGAQVMTG
jgi:hypothetical protein